MNVRRAQPGDETLWVSALKTLVSVTERQSKLVTDAELRQAFTAPGCYLYLAFSNAEPVGLLSAYRFPDVVSGGELVYLYDIEVAQEHRRKGLGAALVTKLKEECRADGVRLIWAGTVVDNLPARKIFEITGAELEGEAYVEYEWTLEE